MASPDEPEETVGGEPGRLPPLSATPAEPPVYRPRHRIARHFWSALIVAAIITAAVVWLVLR
jgi:hypothetical protein